MTCIIGLLPVTVRLMRGCGNSGGGGSSPSYIFPINSCRAVGDDFGILKGGYSYGMGVAPRVKERAFTILTVLGNVPLRALRGMLKRGSVLSARICTRLVGPGIKRSASEVYSGVNSICHLTG